MFVVVAAIATIVAGCGRSGGDQGELVVFAASSLTEAAEELVSGEEALGGARAELVTGGSASLAAQIRDGAPADVDRSEAPTTPVPAAARGTRTPGPKSPAGTRSMSGCLRGLACNRAKKSPGSCIWEHPKSRRATGRDPSPTIL